MNNYQIELFNDLVKTNSFSQTAKNFTTAYQNVIYQIKNLEKEFDTNLFVRNKNGCTLTESGKIFSDYAQKYTNNYKEIQHKINLLKSKITFGIDDTFLDPIVSIFATNNKGKIIYTPMKYTELYDALKNEIIDCYFGYERNWDKSISFLPIYDDKLYLVTSKNNPLASRPEITFSEIKNFIINLSTFKNLIYKIPIKDLEKNNTINTNSAISVVDYRLETGTEISITTHLRQLYFSSKLIFIPITDTKITYGLFYKRNSKAIMMIKEKLKSAANLIK